MLALLFADGNDVTWMVTLMVFDIGEYLQAIYCPPALAETLVIDGMTPLGGQGLASRSWKTAQKEPLVV